MTTEILGLDEIIASQAQKEVAHNTALRQIEGRLVRALSKAVAVPPSSPAGGASYIVAAGGSGAWTGQDGKIAHFFGGAWKFWQPVEGVRLWVNDEDKVYAWDGAAWVVQGGDPAAAVSAGIAAHVAETDPHTQYALESTIGQIGGIASLGADGKVPAAQLPASATTDGTVTSVSLTAPIDLFDVTGSPVTTTGTLAVGLKTQAANTVLAGPTTGVAAAPTMRALVAADLPAVYQPTSEKGVANGYASLGADGLVPASQLPASSGSGTAQPFDVHGFYPGKPAGNAKILRVPVARAVTFPGNMVGSYAIAGVAATASATMYAYKNGSALIGITFAAGSLTGSLFTGGGSAVSFVAGDILQVLAPETADATLADIGFVLAGTR